MSIIRITFKGSTPLLMHNPQMVDPENPINRQIKVLTGKRKKTDDDISAIQRLEFMGGLYLSGENGHRYVSQPTAKVRKCLRNTAAISRLGKQLERAVNFTSVDVPLIFDGSPDFENPTFVDPEELWAKDRYRSWLSVGIGQKRVMRMRPQFMPWALVVDALFVPEAMNFDDLQRIVELAGTVEGIGDNRTNGYGRFSGAVEVLSS